MRLSDYLDLRLPERTAENDDRADIDVLTTDFEIIDSYLEGNNTLITSINTTLTNHVNNFNNPHLTSAAQVGAYTTAQVDAIRDALQSEIDDTTTTGENTSAALQEHIEDTDNPHQTTAGQVGAYDTAETNALLDEKVTQGTPFEGNRVLVTDPSPTGAVTSEITVEELETLSGIESNIQAQIDNLYAINPRLIYQPGFAVTLTESSFPDQDIIDAEVIPQIQSRVTAPQQWYAITVNVSTSDGTATRALLYVYYDGSITEFIGWQYVTEIEYFLYRAGDNVLGVVESSDDISYTDGLGVVNHALRADNADAAEGLTELQIGVDEGAESTDLDTYYGLEKASILWAGAGNTVAHKPEGVDAFFVIPVRAAAGHTVQLLYASESGEYSGAWSREYDATAWSEWRNLLRDVEQTITPIQLTNLSSNPNTWGIPGGLSSSDSFKVWFASNASGLPSGWGVAAGSGIFSRQLSDGSGTLVIFRQATSPSGNSVQMAWKSWNENTSFWNSWHVLGNDVGQSSLPFVNGYFSGNVNARSVTADGMLTGVNLQVFEDATISGDLTVQDGITLNGSRITAWPTFDGSAYLPKTAGVSNPLTGDLYTQANVIPYADNTYNLGGGATRRWRNGYFASLTLNGQTITEWPSGGSDLPIASGTGTGSLVLNYVEGGANNNTVTSDYGTAAGRGNTVSGINCFAAGQLNTIQNAASAIALGYQNYISSGNYTIALGQNNNLTGTAGHTGIGYYIQSNSTGPGGYGLVTVGKFNAPIAGPSTSGATTGAQFVVGNGTDAARRSNALVVDADGTIYIADPTGALTGTTTRSATVKLQDVVGSTLGREILVGSTTAGHTASDCDYLCIGTNDQSTIVQALNAAGTGGTVRLLNATYTIGATLVCDVLGVTLRGTDKASTIISPATTMSAASDLISSVGMKISDLTLSGVQGSTTGAGVITARSRSFLHMTDCVIQNVGNGIVAAVVPAPRLEIVRCSISASGNAITNFGANSYIAYNTIIFNQSQSTSYYGIYTGFLSGSAPQGNAVIENNTITTPYTARQAVNILVSEGYAGPVIRNNTLAGGIVCGSSYALIDGNVIQSAFSTGISLSLSAEQVTVRNNKLLATSTAGAAGSAILAGGPAPHIEGNYIGTCNTGIAISSTAINYRVINNTVAQPVSEPLSVVQPANTNSTSVVITGNAFPVGAPSILGTLPTAHIYANNALATGPMGSTARALTTDDIVHID